MMNSVRRIYKIGRGPSSSHGIGPCRAAELFRQSLNGTVQRVIVELYGGLAATGVGHLTDKAISAGLAPLPVEFLWNPEQLLPVHPNGMELRAVDDNEQIIATWRVYSIGGGELVDDNGPVEPDESNTYQHTTIAEITKWCGEHSCQFWEYPALYDETIWDFLHNIWSVMTDAVQQGLVKDGLLPGELKLKRRAKEMLLSAHARIGGLRDCNLLSAYALAVAEENAAGSIGVTAPTCGACGVLPAVLYYFQQHYNITENEILRALATAGLFGASVANRASISGAQVGCQGEIGTACAMASAAATQLLGGTLQQIEYAAEMGLEHFLGLTCDPICGLVQIPCIERNAFAAMRAYECASYSLSTDGRHIVGFDDVVDVMNKTGRDLQAEYRETAQGGLAEIMRTRLNLQNTD